MARVSYIPNPAKIKVVGLGGAGCNAITRMVREGVRGVEFIAMNTDAQSLAITESPIRLQIGEKLTRGLGAGGDRLVGQKAAEESRDEIKAVLHGADMVFITLGLGGGTGTGSASLVAEISKQNGALTIGVVTKPFAFEGMQRSKVATEGANGLISKVDTLIIIPNDRLLKLCDERTPVEKAFQLADEVLMHGVQSIAEVVNVPGLINLDYADVRSVMKEAGPAWMSVGYGTGKNKAVEAAKAALSSPLLDVSIRGASGVLFNVVGSSDLTLFEVNEAAQVIKQAVDSDANIIFGVAQDERMNNEVRITLIATGFASGALLGSSREEETKRLLESVKSDEELDIPTFLRRSNRRIFSTSPERLERAIRGEGTVHSEGTRSR